MKLAETGQYVELYRRSRIKIRDGRATPSLEPISNINCNLWSLCDAGATYFLPVNKLTWLYINGVLEIFNETTNAFVVDERNGFRPAGLAPFARSRGGHLYDDPRQGRVVTIQQLENFVTEFVTIEQGMMVQNIALMVQALGLGGFPHWAAHAFTWFQALGFRMGEMQASRYLGMGTIMAAIARLIRRDPPVPYVLGLEHNGVPLLSPMTPPYFPSMEAAVRALVEHKVGPNGIFRGGAIHSAFGDPAAVANAAPAPSEASIQASIAYCEYVHGRYGRFPPYAPPLRTVLGAVETCARFQTALERDKAARIEPFLAEVPELERAAILPAQGPRIKSTVIFRGQHHRNRRGVCESWNLSRRRLHSAPAMRVNCRVSGMNESPRTGPAGKVNVTYNRGEPPSRR